MGRGIAGCLVRSGVPLTVSSRTRARAEELLAAGAAWAANGREVARAVEGGVIFTVLPEAVDVRRALFGRGGVVNGARPGTLVVDLSTVAPDQSRALAERLAPRGVRFLDAPLGGSREAAESGELLLYVGGPEEELRRAEPYLARFSRRVEHMGPVGAGSAMKLVNNLLTIAGLELNAEALTLGEAMGLERARLLEVLLAGGARSAMLERKRKLLESGEYPPAFRLSLARKDLRLVERAARTVHQQLPVARQARRLFDRAVREGDGELDFSAIQETVRRLGPLAPASPKKDVNSGATGTGPRSA
jgi:3-hydroxyisobutyrate dehydrogenase-like beta-hydroxyacid dehydrogenase